MLKSLLQLPIKHTINITENDVSEFNIAPKKVIDNAGGSVGIGSS